MFNTDSDSNLANLSNFNYYDDHEFRKLSNKPSFKVEQKLGILNTNTCSISKNLETLQTLITNLEYNFDIIAVSETWHTIKNDTYIKKLKMKGFHDYVGLKGSSMKGGCGFSIGDNLSFLPRDDITKSLNETNCEFEAIWLEILNKAGKNILIGAVYNHPRKDSAPFSDYLQSVFNKIYRENKLVILSGDFNLNLLKHNKIPNVEAFLNLMLANFYRPLITHPTRIHADSCPCLIDNIFINTLEYETVSGNLTDSVSDHLPNFTFLAN